MLKSFLCNKIIKQCNYRYNRIVLLSTEQITKRVPFKLADIGEGIAEVELLKWFVKKGDLIKSFDRICEVQSDKATVEITSRYDGIISTVHHTEGSIVKVGEALIDIDVNETSSGRSKLVTDSSNPVLHGGNKPNDTANDSNNIQFKHDNDDINDKVLTTPSVRKMAKENNINLMKVNPSGPKGRILKEDILAYLNGSNQREISRPVVSQSKTYAPPSTPIIEKKSTAEVPLPRPHTNDGVSNADKIVPIKGVQRIMVKSMTAALQVQHLTYSDEIVVDQLITFRKLLKAEAEKRNIRISYMPFIIKATSLALEQFPILNATVNADVSAMTYHANHNIGVAIDTSKGLVVPVIKNVQNKSIFDIAQELILLQESAVKGTLTEAQLSNGTFSLSNIGSIGGTYVVPVVVVPQVAIGAFGRQQLVPRYMNDDPEAEIKPVTIMNISWSADHRVIDGATVARFSNLFKRYVEEPSLMLGLMK